MKNDLLAAALSLKLKKPDGRALKLLLNRHAGLQRDRTGLGPGKVMLGIEHL